MAKSPFYRVQIESNGRDISDLISSFSFEDCLNEDDFLNLTFGNVTNSMIDDEDFNRDVTLVFTYGYLGGKVSPKRIAKIVDQDVNYAKTRSMTIKCLDKGFALKKQTSNKVYKNMTVSEMVAEIARAFLFETNIEETDTVYEALPQGNKTYFDFIQFLATLVPGGQYRFYIKDNVLNFNSRDLSKDPVKLFVYDGGNNNVKSFNPKYDQDASGASDKVTAKGIDPETGQEISAESTDDTASETGLGKTRVSYDVNGNRGDVDTNREEIEQKVSGKHETVPVENAEDLKNQTDKIKKDASLGELTMTLKIEGDPTVFSDDIVSVGGVAQKHKGNWFCEKITHSIAKGSGYETTVEGAKNATDKATGEGTNDVATGDQNRDVGPDEANKTNEVKDVHYNPNGVRG